MIYIFTGNGKGKTTAALGSAMRAVGEGKRVLMVQFIKGPWKSGEDNVEIVPKDNFSVDLKTPSFCLVKMGRGFVGILGDSLPREDHEKAAHEALEFAAKEASSGNWDIIILDEVNNAVALNLISSKLVLELFGRKTGNTTDWILTGRDAPLEFIEIADLVTEMGETKHQFNRGVKGKRGFEY